MTFRHLGDVLAEVEPLGQMFANAGYRLYLVGGIVRDLWIDEPLDAASDIDLTTNALPADIKRLVSPVAEALWSQGERFGTIGLRALGRDYEITTHRAESYASDSRKPQVTFGDDIAIDLSRRDFTVNAMAIELPDGELVDPYGGAADLEAGVLRTPLSAEISFSDDPLRMLRAARFGTKYSLDPVEELVASAEQLHDRLRIVAIERICIELRKLLDLPLASQGLQFLTDAGLLTEVLSYGQESANERVVSRLAQAIDVADRLPADWRLRLAGIGLTVYDDADGVRALCRRLKLSREHERFVTHTSRSARSALDAADTEPATVRRWIAACNDIAAALQLAQAVSPDGGAGGFVQAVNALVATESMHKVSVLDGETIMKELAIAPGPVVGQARAFLQDRCFELGPLTSEDQLELLRTWSQG